MQVAAPNPRDPAKLQPRQTASFLRQFMSRSESEVTTVTTMIRIVELACVHCTNMIQGQASQQEES